MNQQECDKLYSKGMGKLKTSFFSFKFSPDYVGAIDDFTAAAKGFRKLGQSGKSITCFKKAIECNHHINDYWAEGNCYVSIAEIYFFDLKTPDQGIEALNKASYAYQVSGKFTYSVKAFITTAERFMENKEYEIAGKILKEAFNVCEGNTEDKLVGATFEQIFNKLLDVLCGLNKWEEAIGITQKYIDAQKKYPEKDNYRINKTYMKLCILRIITKEEFLCEDIFIQMFNCRYEDTATDIGDIRKLMDALKDLDKKKFTYCVSSAFTLFENNLLKGLQVLYKEKEEEKKNGGTKIEDNVNIKKKDDNNDINTDNPPNNNNINNAMDNEDLC